MTPEEKKAYNRQYYLEYKKKGKKKGRKKGSGKTKTTTQKLVGLGTAGLNDAGKMNWAMAKENLQKEMNKELASATSEEEKAKIRADYQNRALQTLQGMKNDSAYAKAKKTKSASTKKTTSASTQKANKPSRNSANSASNGNSKKSSQNAEAESYVDTTSTVKSTSKDKTSDKGIKVTGGNKKAQSSTTAQTVATLTEQVEQLRNEVQRIKEQLPEMSAEKKEELKTGIENILNNLKTRISGGEIEWMLGRSTRIKL